MHIYFELKCNYKKIVYTTSLRPSCLYRDKSNFYSEKMKYNKERAFHIFTRFITCLKHRLYTFYLLFLCLQVCHVLSTVITFFVSLNAKYYVDILHLAFFS